MTRIYLFIFRIALFLFLSTPFLSTSVLQASDSKALEQKIHHLTLKNGLQVLILSRPISPTVSLYIRYRAGAVDERDGQTGLAHLLEHMMFKGTKTIGTKNIQKEEKLLREIAQTGQAFDDEIIKGEKSDQLKIVKLREKLQRLQKKHQPWMISNEIDRLYSEAGAVHLNASTSQDLTTYHVSLPANKIELWARIESDRMANPVFREFYQERNVVLEERRQRVDSNPEGRLYEAFLSSAFTAHSYRRPIIGWSSDISRLSIRDLDIFFRQFHAPNNTVIAIVGDIDPKQIRILINGYFARLKQQTVMHHKMTIEPQQTGEKRISVHLDANPQLIIGYHKPPPPAMDDYVLDVIESILSRGRTSRFYKTLVEEKGLAEDVQTSNSAPGSRYPNLFTIFATPQHPHSSRDLEVAIYELIEQLKTEPIPDQELQKIKNQVRADFIRRQSSNEGLAGMLSYYQALLGDFRYMIQYADAIEKITADDIMRVAKAYLHKHNRTVAVIDKE